MKLRLRHWLPSLIIVFLVIAATAWSNGWFAQTTADASGSITAPAPGSAGDAAPGDAATARAQLAELVVKPDGSMAGYSRDRFPHWSKVEGECDTRETVLKRDGQNVQVDAQCRPISGSWFSPYDGATWTKASDVDIDHWVPLAAAWRSGAAQWSDQHRREFANDLVHRQLIAVTDNVNQQKGDKSPDQWKPPLVIYWCTYSVNWISVKQAYALSITAAEKNALSSMLDRC